MVTVCDKCGQPLEPGVISCKVDALDIRANGTAVLILDAICPACGEVIVIEWFLFCRAKEEK